MPLLFGGSFQLLIGCVWNLSHWLEYNNTYNIMMSPYFFGAYIMLDTYDVGLFTDVMIPLDIIHYSSIYIYFKVDLDAFIRMYQGPYFFVEAYFKCYGEYSGIIFGGGFDIGGIIIVNNIFMRLSLLQMCLLVIL